MLALILDPRLVLYLPVRLLAWISHAVGPEHFWAGVSHLPAAVGLLAGHIISRRLFRAALLHGWPRYANWAYLAVWSPLLLLLIATSLLVGEFGPLTPLLSAAAFSRPITQVGCILFYVAAAWLLFRTLPVKMRKGNLAAGRWAAHHDVIVAGGVRGALRRFVFARWLERPPYCLPVELAHRAGPRPPRWDLSPAVIAPTNETANRHTLIEGGSGSGKGVFVLGHIIATATRPYVYQDVKAECPLITERWQTSGKVPIIWGCGRPGGWPSLSWNALQEVYDDPHCEDACSSLAGALIPKVRGENAWVSDTARLLLTHIFASRVYPHLAALYDDLKEHGISAVLQRAGLPAGLAEQLAGKNVKEYASNTLQTTLEPFGSGWGRAVTTEHCFTLADALRHDTYVLSAEPQEQRRLPLQVFWRLLFARMLRAERLRTMLLLDEGLAAGYIPGLPDALNTIRSKGGAIFFAYQNTGGLEAVYGKEAKAVSEAFGSSIVLLSGLNPEDLKAVSDQVGQYTVVKAHLIDRAKGEQAAALLPLDVAGALARRPHAKWAVIRIPEVTRSGRPILARMMPSSFAVEPPTDSYVKKLRRAWPAQQPIVAAPSVPSTPTEPGTAPALDINFGL